MDALSKRKELKNLFTFFASNYPQYELVINNDVAMQKGVSIEKAMDNLSILIGSTYEQGFVRFGQFYKVYVQAAPQFRRFPEDLENLFVKNDSGEMVPYSSFMQIKKKQGLNEITRFNVYPSAAIQGAPASGYSSGQAINAIKEVAAKTLPRGYGIGWEGISYDESRKGNQAVYIFGIVVFFVYLVLVGQYESFLLPLAVIISLPVGIFGSFLFLTVHGVVQRRLRPDQHGHAGRSARQERDLDRRIRRAAAPGRPEPPGGGRRRRTIALPADSDDLLRLHRGSHSAWSLPPAPGPSETAPSAPPQPAECSWAP